MKKEHILQEIKRTAEANGGVPLGRARFLAETGIREADWLGKFWARWGDAIREAGYSPNQLQAAYETEFLLETYIGLIRELRKVPASGDLRLKAGTDPDFPNWKTFDRLGSKSEVVKSVLEYCRERKGYEDVAALCKQYSPRSSKTLESVTTKGETGFIYLMKSGKFYKLGRSNATGRREYELGIQLPEKLKTVHVIRTDDPAGIEAYWHNRFAVKRKGGEWFDLDAADVAAFKRRKFM
jgi:Meiotically up-regulated gene 113